MKRDYYTFTLHPHLLDANVSVSPPCLPGEGESSPNPWISEEPEPEDCVLGLRSYNLEIKGSSRLIAYIMNCFKGP